MGVFAEVIDGLVLSLYAVADVAAVDGVGSEGLVERIVVDVGKAVPAPFRFGAERNAFVKGFGEGLQAGDVDGEGEAAVADGQCAQRIGCRVRRVVAIEEGVPVDGGVNG